jgi:hypothetical protein
VRLATLTALHLLCLVGRSQPTPNPSPQSPSPDVSNIASDQPSPPKRPAREFLPSVHGFAFRNAFTGSPLPPSLRGLGLEQAAGAPSHYGKCGGMSLAAADYFLAKRPIPDANSVPAEGTPLFAYITRRQLDSLGPMFAMVSTFMKHMALPDRAESGESAASLTHPQIAPLVKRLEAGELVPLGLVYVAARKDDAKPAADVGALWENHQVLAFAAPDSERTWPSEGLATIRIYDPNFPKRDDVTIVVKRLATPPGSPEQVSCEEHVGATRVIRVRGLFPMPYSPTQPPVVEHHPKSTP